MKNFIKLLAVSLIMLAGILTLSSNKAQAFQIFDRNVKDSGAIKVVKVCDHGGTGGSPACAAPGTYNPNPFVGNGGILVRAAILLSWVIGAAAVAMICYGGLQYITSRGDAQKAVNARNTVLYSCVGIIVAVVAQVSIAFIINRLT